MIYLQMMPVSLCHYNVGKVLSRSAYVTVVFLSNSHCIPSMSSPEFDVSSPTFRRFGGHSTALETISVTELENLNQTKAIDHDPIGRPTKKPLLSVRDVGIIAVAHASCAVSLAAVWSPWIAVRLGQNTQLQTLSFTIAIMFRSMSTQCRFVLPLIEARFGNSVLQSFDALLRNDLFAVRLGLPLRAILVALLLLQITLPLLDKEFSFGTSATPVSPPSMDFGMYAAPGLAPTGNGLALAVNAYLPFWNEQRIDATYGYHLYIKDNTSAALLDTPDPNVIAELQRNLSIGQSFRLSANVNGTVSEKLLISDTDSPLLDPRGRRVESEYLNKTMYLSSLLCSAIFAPYDSTEYLYAGIYDCDEPTSTVDAFQPHLFRQAVRGYEQSRQCYHGVWNITSSNITLVGAHRLLNQDQASCRNQSVLNLPYVEIDWMFPLLTEFDWVWWPRDTDMDTLPALAASSAWARTVAILGLEQGTTLSWRQRQTRKYFSPWRDEARYRSPDANVSMELGAITLKRSAWLAVVLMLQPFLTTVAFLAKLLLYSVPIGEGFGLVSVLSGVSGNAEKLRILDGAGLSGSLSRDARLCFTGTESGTDAASVSIDLDSRGTPLRSKRDVPYR